MSLLNVQPKTLELLLALAKDPSSAVPAALLALDPDGPWDLLTQRLGSAQLKALANQAELSLPLLDESSSHVGALSSKWVWSASVDLNARLAIDLLAEEDLAELGIQPDTGQTLVAYGASLAFGGSLGAETSATAWGSAGASVGGRRSTAVRWFVQARQGDLLLHALNSAQAHFVSPDDLQSMIRLANRTDWFGLEMALQGEAQLALDVEAKAAGTGWTFSMDGEQSSVGLSAGLDASFKARRASDWVLRVTAVPLSDGGSRLGLRVSLHDLRLRHQQAAVSFNAGADFSAVTASAERVLRAAWPELDSDLLDALARPGTALGGKLASLIEEKLDGPLKDLATLLTGGGGGDALKKQLAEKLSGGLGDVLDGAVADISAGKADVNRALAEWLKRVLGSAAGALTIVDDLKAVVAGALNQATQGLEDAIARLKHKIVGQSQDKVDALLKTLGELGAQFEGALDRVDDNTAAQAIRAAIARYGDLRSKLSAKLTDATRQKVMLTLSGEWKRDTSDEAVVEVVFVPPKPGHALAPEAELLYHAICGGRLLALPQLVAAAQRAGSIGSAHGWLLSTAKTLSTQRANLNFFGVLISSNTSWLREVGVKVDLVTGDLLMARGSLSVETSIANPWMNRKARLGVQLELEGGKPVTPVLTASLNGAFAAIAGDFASRDKVQDLLDAYAHSTGSQRVDVERMLDVPTGAAGKKFWKELTLSIPVNLDAGQWRGFAERDSGEIDAVSLEVALRLFDRRYRPDSLFSNDPVADLAGYAAAYFDALGQSNAGLLAYLKQFPQGWVGRFSASSEALKLAIPAVVSGGALDRGGRIFMALQRLSATVQAPGRLQVLARQAADRVRSAPAPVDPQALRQSLDGILQKMQHVLAPVALVSETWLGIGVGAAEDEPVSWPFASFVTTMARLSGMPVPPGYVPVAQVAQGLPTKLLPLT